MRTALFTALFLLAGGALGATISGTVTNSDGGAPIAGATIILTSVQGGGGGGGVALDTVVSGADGSYSFANLEPGAFLVEASLDGYSSDQGFALIQQADQTETEDFQLTQVVGGGNGTITGTVTSSAGDAPIAGASVTLYLRTGGGPGGGGSQEVATTTTDASGVYSFADLPTSETYDVAVSADGFGSDRQNQIDGFGGNNTITENFQLTPANGIINGTVTDITDAPVAGALIILYSRVGGGGGGFSTPIDSAATDAAGNYQFTGLDLDGNYDVSAQKPGYVNDRDNNNNGFGQNGTITVDLVLAPATGVIDGTVVDQQGNPVPNVGVHLRLQQGFGGQPTVIKSVTTDANGAFSFDQLAPSNFQNQYSISVNNAIENNIDVNNGETTVVQITVQDATPVIQNQLGSIEWKVSQFGDNKVISFIQLNEPVQIQIYNSLGKLVTQELLSANNNNLPLENSLVGEMVYMMLKTNGKVESHKFFLY